MTKEEFEVWWKENWICCTAEECNKHAYGLVRELLANARERIAQLLEREGKTGASSFVRMMTVDGFGNGELDLWPRDSRDQHLAGSGGGVAILISTEGELFVKSGTGRTLHDTTHDYPGLEAWKKDQKEPFPEGRCRNGCEALMCPSGYAAPSGIDPFGDCPAVVNKPLSS